MVDLEIIKTALLAFKKDVITREEADKEILKNLKKIGWLKEENGKYRFAMDLETFAGILSTMIAKKEGAVEVPFRSRIYGKKTFAYIRLPAFIIRTFKITQGDLLVIRYGDVRIAGTISTHKYLFYIHKKYWKDLGIPDEGIAGKSEREYSFVLEGIYRGLEKAIKVDEETGELKVEG